MVTSGANLKIAQILETSNVKILLYLLSKGEVRHSALSKVIPSRSTLSVTLVQLEEEEGLIQRRAVTEPKPIQSFYSLTEKGKAVAEELQRIQQLMK